ncbi:MAG: ABC transporter substrate binding protein, partial [Dehalococcoidia bacterium]
MVIHSGLLQGMEDWDNDEAKEFVLNNIRVPIGTVNKPMMPHSVFGLAKGIGENGEWAARTALRILDGTDPSDIPETTNKEATIMVNLDLAEKLDIIFSPDILKNAEIYQ